MSCIWFFLHHCFRDMVFINECFRLTARELLLETWYLRLTILTCSKPATWMLQYLAKKSVSFRDYSATCNLKYWCKIMSKTKKLNQDILLYVLTLPYCRIIWRYSYTLPVLHAYEWIRRHQTTELSKLSQDKIYKLRIQGSIYIYRH